MAQYQDHYQQQPQYPQGYPEQQPQTHMPQQPDVAHTYTSPQAMNEKPLAHDHTHNKLPAQGSKKWAFGLFDCFSPLDVCCISFWCPCYMFGKTYQRNKSSEQNPSGFNGMCCAYLATLYCGCAPILQCMQRQNTREKHNIDGGCFGDFCSACCCACCALIQEEKESVVRQTGMDPTTGAVYQPVPQMNYSA